jgi:hypothetical protein
MNGHPARVSDVEIEEIADGYLVLDQRQQRVHYLNHIAALVLELCTGGRDDEEIARLLQRAYELGEPPLQDVRACLSALVREGLVS